MSEKRKLIYLASPYSSEYQDIVERRVRQVTEVTARLIARGEVVVFSPIVHSHPLSDHLPASTNTWDFWKAQDEVLLAACDELWILELDGWEKSTGVSGEIMLALKAQKTIRNISYPELSEVSRIDGYEGYEPKLPAIEGAASSNVYSFLEANKAKLDLSVGNRDDSGKTRYDLIPAEAIKGLAEVLTAGAAKYNDNNWRKGMEFGRCFGSLNRHLWKFWMGEDFDEETGLHHLAHVLCNTAFLLVYSVNGFQYRNYDDRPIKRATLKEAA